MRDLGGRGSGLRVSRLRTVLRTPSDHKTPSHGDQIQTLVPYLACSSSKDVERSLLAMPGRDSWITYSHPIRGGGRTSDEKVADAHHHAACRGCIRDSLFQRAFRKHRSPLTGQVSSSIFRSVCRTSFLRRDLVRSVVGRPGIRRWNHRCEGLRGEPFQGQAVRATPGAGAPPSTPGRWC